LIRPSEIDLSSLANPFTEEEIKITIFKLAKGKTCRPDGFPSEFFQNYWEIIKTDIIDLLNDFYDNKVDLWRLNKAHITLLHKTPGATRIKDFRPISVLSAISKIITKILAERLRLFLPHLISP
jgi:hypothetical protein